MRIKTVFLVCIIFSASQVACGQAQKAPAKQELGEPGPPAPKAEKVKVADAPEVDKGRIKKKAEELSTAFVEGDFGRVADLTYPDLVELSGGKAKIVSKLEIGMGGWRAQGFQLSSLSVDEPTQVIKARDYLFAVVPATMRMKVPEGVLAQQTFHLGVSRDGGETWTFVDGGGTGKEKLKILFPTVASAIDSLELPEEKLPTLEKKQ
ncbi:MAG: hypothetical protein ACRD9R_10590 [Pyrinomonadaceae bacterium]